MAGGPHREHPELTHHPMIRPLYIFGTGGFARETYWLVSDINRKEPTFEVMGFIDRSRDREAIMVDGRAVPVLVEAEVMNGLPVASELVIGIGDPRVIARLHGAYRGIFKFANLVHPTVAGYFATIRLGEGNIVTAGCIFTLDIVVGDCNIFNLHTTVGHDAVIGSYNVMNPGVNISGGVKLGDRNLLGTNAAVLQDITIGDDNVVGASAMVNRHVESSVVTVGVPARVIKQRT
jgi:sugar O-acyltransferase (sialic acid O-acetyltransferase NeuD family)